MALLRPDRERGSLELPANPFVDTAFPGGHKPRAAALARLLGGKIMAVSWINVLLATGLLGIGPTALGCGADPTDGDVALESANRLLPLSSEASGACRLKAHLVGDEEVPPRETQAVGQAQFRLNASETELSYKLIVANIDNVIAAHIHVAPPGVNGPVVLFLAGPFASAGGPSNGILAQDTVTAADLVGPLAGHPLSDLVAAMRAGNTYVNVHTSDGVPPDNTGPGDFPGGEIRGQIEPIGAACREPSTRQLR